MCYSLAHFTALHLRGLHKLNSLAVGWMITIIARPSTIAKAPNPRADDLRNTVMANSTANEHTNLLRTRTNSHSAESARTKCLAISVSKTNTKPSCPVDHESFGRSHNTQQPRGIVDAEKGRTKQKKDTQHTQPNYR